MGNYGNQWNFYGPKWSKLSKPCIFDHLLVGLVAKQAVGTICGMKIIQIIPMVSQAYPSKCPQSRKSRLIHSNG
jgi:hypothetical protein